ncbi:MAG TPA: lipase maturation factor family protein [Acidobacteriaceae bacterium]|jgi:hypothetical protein
MFSLNAYFGEVVLTRMLLQRGMALIYLVAFISVLRQFKPLLGERGLLPVPEYLKGASFSEAPSIFWWRYSDRLLDLVAWTGTVISACALFGLTEAGPLWLSVGSWLLLWVLYLSVVNVGQQFFGFGWESMLLEAGFFTAFLGPAHMQPSILPVLILRWMLFRTELGAGLIKLRHDSCWRDLTCLFYHYETQPLPNPLSWYFHRLPRASHRSGVLFSHFVQVIVPFALFAPQPIASIAAGLCIAQQLWLIISGNYSWLNWLTAVLGVAGLSDRFLTVALPLHTPQLMARPLAFEIVLYVIAAGTITLSVQPVMNLFSKHQRMNFSYNRYHLVNTYGAFGSVGRERYEIVIEGTAERVILPSTPWKEYGFRAKPGDLKRMPPQVAPYHLRLDWMIWFLPFTVLVTPNGIRVRGYERWFARFIQRLLKGDRALLRLMGKNPFQESPPVYIRALFYRYRYTDAKTKAETGAWWTRELLGVYMQPISLDILKDV